MRWSNLQQNKCPKCGSLLIYRGLGVYDDDTLQCDFRITETKFNELKNKLELDQLEKEREGWER